MNSDEAKRNMEIEENQSTIVPNKTKLDYTIFNVGQKIKDEKISEIFIQKDDYIIYCVENQPAILKYQNNDNVDITNEQTLRFRSKKVELDLLKKKVCPSEDYNSIIANSFSLCLEGKKEGVLMLDDLISELHKEFNNQVEGRIFYYSVPIIISLSFLIASLVLKHLQTDIFSAYLLYINCLFFGSLGTALSLMLAAQNKKLDISLGKKNIVFISLGRIFIGAASSIIIIIFVKSNVALGFLESANQSSNYYFYLLSVMAGFFERFIPDIFSSIRKSSARES